MPITDLELGQLLQRVETMEKQLEAQGKMISEMREIIVSAKGSWRTLVVVGGVMSVVGGLVAKFWPFH